MDYCNICATYLPLQLPVNLLISVPALVHALHCNQWILHLWSNLIKAVGIYDIYKLQGAQSTHRKVLPCNKKHTRMSKRQNGQVPYIYRTIKAYRIIIFVTENVTNLFNFYGYTEWNLLGKFLIKLPRNFR